MLQKIILATTSGILLTGSFPETGLSCLAWFALLPLLIAVKDLNFRQSFRLGLLAGLVHYLTLLYWLSYTMKTYGHLPVYLSVPVLFLFSSYLALYIALFSGMFSWISSGPLFSFFMIPVLWVSVEYIRSFLFTGFPWELIAYSQYKSLHIIQAADMLGPYGISFLLAMSNAAFFTGFSYVTGKRRHEKKISIRHFLIPSLVFILTLSGFWYYGKNRVENTDMAVSDSAGMKIAVIQGNISQSEKWDPAFQHATVKKYLNLSSAAVADKPELIVWPETAAPFYFLYDARLTKKVQNGIADAGTDFLIGSPSFVRNVNNTEFYNSAYLLDSDGKVTGKYDKVHLVPFGEYVPLKRWLPFLGKMVEQVGDFSSGRKGSTISFNGHKIGVLICYELIFPYLARAEVKYGAGFLVNITNDAWYGRTGAPHQHFSMAVFRAVENRRALVRAANTGISGFIDPAGRIVGSTPLFEDAVMTKRVPVLSEMTFYTRFGDLFAFSCIALVILVFLVKSRKK
ncbi:MAG: apolipoprotein N-acyltransferase [Desulfobacteraceae bacterium]|nr:MAG: apolipoprotein N-acyltransferase [Desulfobacteraceae bacterium]